MENLLFLGVPILKHIRVISCSYNFIENLCLKGALGVCSVLPQALQGGIIRVLKTHFLVLNKNFRFFQTNNFSEVI